MFFFNLGVKVILLEGFIIGGGALVSSVSVINIQIYMYVVYLQACIKSVNAVCMCVWYAESCKL